MLTADLVRAGVRQGVLRPRWIDPADLQLQDGVASLIAAFTAHVGKQVGELDDAITDQTVAHADPLLWKGFVKLLHDRCETETRAAVPPSEIRAAVFGEAGRRWPIGPDTRAAALEAAAKTLGIGVAEVEVGLYADRGNEQWLVKFEAPTPEALLKIYNLALAQAALFKARELRVELGELDAKRARAVLRELKFRRLLARVEATTQGWKLTLDGPLSLFKPTGRYGIQLALFLPALVRCPTWRLEADVVWGPAKRPVMLQLSNDSPLEVAGHHHDQGTWVSAEEEHFVKGFEALASPWQLSSDAVLVDLDGRDVLAPDYVLRHPDGRELLIEMVHAWRRPTFLKRAELLRAAGPKNLVVVWAERGGLDAEAKAALSDDLGLPGLLRFKGVIPPRKVLALAEQLGARPAVQPPPQVAPPTPKKSAARARAPAKPRGLPRH